MITRAFPILRISLALAGFAAASPAWAQAQVEASLITVSEGAVLNVCTKALEGAFDLTNTAQLDEWGLTPVSGATLAELRNGVPGIDAAEARFDNGYILVGFVRGTSCAVQIKGEGRIAARDALIRMLLDTGMDYQESTTPNGDQLLTFPFRSHPMYVFTSTTGNVMVQVR